MLIRVQKPAVLFRLLGCRWIRHGPQHQTAMCLSGGFACWILWLPCGSRVGCFSDLTLFWWRLWIHLRSPTAWIVDSSVFSAAPSVHYTSSVSGIAPTNHPRSWFDLIRSTKGIRAVPLALAAITAPQFQTTFFLWCKIDHLSSTPSSRPLLVSQYSPAKHSDFSRTRLSNVNLPRWSFLPKAPQIHIYIGDW